MANGMLFYRTPTTTQDSITDPNNLPSAQKLLFTPPSDLLAGLDEVYENNIIRKVPPKPFGRKLIQTDEGFKSWIFTISGNYIVNSNVESADKLYNFMIVPQGDSVHKFGGFGILYPNGPNYLNQDPDETKGIMLMRRGGKHVGITKEIFDFSVTMSFGGTV